MIFHLLPELFTLIFSNLSIVDFGRVLRTCKYFNSFAENEYILSKFLEREYLIHLHQTVRKISPRKILSVCKLIKNAHRNNVDLSNFQLALAYQRYFSTSNYSLTSSKYTSLRKGICFKLSTIVSVNTQLKLPHAKVSIFFKWDSLSPFLVQEFHKKENAIDVLIKPKEEVFIASKPSISSLLFNNIFYTSASVEISFADFINTIIRMAEKEQEIDSYIEENKTNIAILTSLEDSITNLQRTLQSRLPPFLNKSSLTPEAVRKNCRRFPVLFLLYSNAVYLFVQNQDRVNPKKDLMSDSRLSQCIEDLTKPVTYINWERLNKFNRSLYGDWLHGQKLSKALREIEDGTLHQFFEYLKFMLETIHKHGIPTSEIRNVALNSVEHKALPTHDIFQKNIKIATLLKQMISILK